MKKFIFLALALVTFQTNAANFMVGNLQIKFIRTVGNYEGSTFDNTIELHFTSPIPWPADSPCTNTARVMIDASHSHMISAAYLAYSSGYSVTINADDTLPNRGGACELSFLDIIK